MRHALLFPFVITLVAAGPSSAQNGPPPAEGVQWSVGVGVIGSPRPYEGAETKILPVPFLGVRAGAFFFETVRLGVRVADTKHFDAKVLVQARFDGHEADDSKALAGMHERLPSADGGLQLAAKWERVQLDLTAVTDVLSRHEGQEVGVGIGFPIEAASWTITPSLGARWQSDKLVDYYFGVEPGEAIASRPAYEADATVNPRVEVKLSRPFARRTWMFLAQVNHEWLGSEVRKSPIVDASSTLGGYFAFIRTFN